MKTATVLEAVAVFDDPDRLENAMSDLQSNGIDRSNLSLLAHPSLAERLPARSRDVADDPATPRDSAVTDTDIRQGRVLGTSLAATIAALAAAGFTVATGGVAAATVAAAAVAAGGVGAVGALLGRRLGEDQEAFSMHSSPVAASSFGSARPTPMRSGAHSECCAATLRKSTSNDLPGSSH